MNVHDIPYEDIQQFLNANGRFVRNKYAAYNAAMNLMTSSNSIGHTNSIIEWMMANNLLIMDKNIPFYTSDEIDNMTQIQIDKLARLLTMKGNDIENIKNILRYLHKLT